MSNNKQSSLDHQNQRQVVAAYVGGAIHINDPGGQHDRVESELITSHEQFHHMLRLTSAFGLYLTILTSSIIDATNSPSPFTLQALASRFRTTDEVLATYASSIMGSWVYSAESIRKILARYPSYMHYYTIGESLVGENALPLVASASVQAIVQFCWSPIDLFNFKSVSVADLYSQLQTNQFPDKRFERFKKLWSLAKWQELAEAMTSDMPNISELLSRPYLQLLDPLYNSIADAKAQNCVFVAGADVQTMRAQEMKTNRMLLGHLAESMLWKGYDYLTAEFRNSDLASSESTLLVDLISQRAEMRAKSALPILSETLFIRTSRRTVSIDDAESFVPWGYVVSRVNERIAPIFIRPMKVLRRHLELPSSFSAAAEAADSLALYSVHEGWDIPVEPLPTRLVELPEWGDVLTFLDARRIIGPVVLWTSDVVEGKVDISRLASRLAVWCVCDSNPYLALEYLQPFIPGLRGLYINSRVPGMGLKALLTYRVGFKGEIEGIVFPGTTSMCEIVGPMLFQVFGDNCRDLNSEGPMIFHEQMVRDAVGRLIVDSISITDGWFAMS